MGKYRCIKTWYNNKYKRSDPSYIEGNFYNVNIFDCYADVISDDQGGFMFSLIKSIKMYDYFYDYFIDRDVDRDNKINNILGDY